MTDGHRCTPHAESRAGYGGRDVKDGGTMGPGRGKTQPFLAEWTRKGCIPSLSLPAVPAVVMVSPVAVPLPIGALHPD
jgi:hypothetical protein